MLCVSVIIACLTVVYVFLCHNQFIKRDFLIDNTVEIDIKKQLIDSNRNDTSIVRRAKETYKYYKQKYDGRNSYHNKIILLYNLNAIAKKYNFKNQSDVRYFDIHNNFNDSNISHVFQTTIVFLNCFSNNINESIKIIEEVENVLPTFAQVSSVNVVPILNVYQDKKFEVYIKVLIKQIVLHNS